MYQFLWLFKLIWLKYVHSAIFPEYHKNSTVLTDTLTHTKDIAKHRLWGALHRSFKPWKVLIVSLRSQLSPQTFLDSFWMNDEWWRNIIFTKTLLPFPSDKPLSTYQNEIKVTDIDKDDKLLFMKELGAIYISSNNLGRTFISCSPRSGRGSYTIDGTGAEVLSIRPSLSGYSLKSVESIQADLLCLIIDDIWVALWLRNDYVSFLKYQTVKIKNI